MILRRMLAIWISKATCVVCKLAGKQGVTLAGKIALKIDPKILMELSGQVRKKIFITCGTNGKTTTNNLLCSAIEAEGEKVICNHTGFQYAQRCRIGIRAGSEVERKTGCGLCVY